MKICAKVVYLELFVSQPSNIMVTSFTCNHMRAALVSIRLPIFSLHRTVAQGLAAAVRAVSWTLVVWIRHSCHCEFFWKLVLTGIHFKTFQKIKLDNWTVKTFNQRSVMGFLQSKSVTSLPQSITELGRILQARLVMILFVWSIVFTSIYHQGFATDEDWTICWNTCKSLWSCYCHKEAFFTFLFRSEDDSPKVCSTGDEHFWDGHCIHCMT